MLASWWWPYSKYKQSCGSLTWDWSRVQMWLAVWSVMTGAACNTGSCVHTLSTHCYTCRHGTVSTHHHCYTCHVSRGSLPVTHLLHSWTGLSNCPPVNLSDFLQAAVRLYRWFHQLLVPPVHILNSIMLCCNRVGYISKSNFMWMILNPSLACTHSPAGVSHSREWFSQQFVHRTSVQVIMLQCHNVGQQENNYLGSHHGPILGRSIWQQFNWVSSMIL